jgi:hypothetical protein
MERRRGRREEETGKKNSLKGGPQGKWWKRDVHFQRKERLWCLANKKWFSGADGRWGLGIWAFFGREHRDFHIEQPAIFWLSRKERAITGGTKAQRYYNRKLRRRGEGRKVGRRTLEQKRALNYEEANSLFSHETWFLISSYM